ncbi:MAG: M48 family metallopeptidase [Chloroflexi bacterium]|nr:M48 family metallopeptidase [Chloroflexota bacterium]
MTIYTRIDANRRNTVLLLVLFGFLVFAVVEVFSLALELGIAGSVTAAVLAGGLSYLGYLEADRIVLGISEARPIDKDDNPELFNLVENLCIGSGLPMPRIYVIDDSAPNAFATGRRPENASIAVTSGLLSKLNKLELEGVLGHELSHIKNYDIRLMTVAAVAVGLVALLSDLFLRYTWFGAGARRRYRGKGEGAAGLVILAIAVAAAILAPIAAQLIRLAISRQREFLADASSALLTRYPEGLAGALEKISRDTEPLEVANKATAHLYIANPLKGQSSWLNDLFSTHPPIEARVGALRAM